MSRQLSRRQFGAGIAGAALLAGCTDPEPAPDDDEPPDDGEEGDVPDDQEPEGDPEDDTGN